MVTGGIATGSVDEDVEFSGRGDCYSGYHRRLLESGVTDHLQGEGKVMKWGCFSVEGSTGRRRCIPGHCGKE